MSDFSELCPLFNTGVYSELTIPKVSFTALSTTNNILAGALAKAGAPGSIKFDRTVIVTKVFMQQQLTNVAADGNIILFKRHLSTGTAAGTVLASLQATATVSLGRVRKMTSVALPKTFLAADVIGFSNKTKDAAAAAKCTFIIRYKEK